METPQFINRDKLYNEVEKIYEKYREAMEKHLEDFLKLKIDPFKFLFDNKFTNTNFEETVAAEFLYQIEKTKQNALGEFQENILKNCIKGIKEPDQTLKSRYSADIADINGKWIAEVKNKHNTMNYGSAKTVFENLKRYVKDHPNNEAYLVIVIDKNSEFGLWKNDTPNVYKASIDQFLKKITNDDKAFYKLTEQIKEIADEIVKEKGSNILDQNKMIKKIISKLSEQNITKIEDFFKETFKTYLGFDK